VEAQKTLWAAELRDMEEVYDPIVCDRTPNRVNSAAGRQNGNRRRHQRLPAEGAAELQQKSSKAAIWKAASGMFRVGLPGYDQKPPLAGKDLKLVLNCGNYDLALRDRCGTRRSTSALASSSGKFARGIGTFLQYLLRKLGEKGNFAEGKREKPQATSATPCDRWGLVFQSEAFSFRKIQPEW